jgi:hypothetical protein
LKPRPPGNTLTGSFPIDGSVHEPTTHNLQPKLLSLPSFYQPPLIPTSNSQHTAHNFVDNSLPFAIICSSLRCPRNNLFVCESSLCLLLLLLLLLLVSRFSLCFFLLGSLTTLITPIYPNI